MRMPPMDFLTLFLENVGRDCSPDVRLSEFSQFRVGGKADYFFEVQTADEIRHVIKVCREYGLPYYFIGGGTNLLFSDLGFRGLILHNRILGIRMDDARKITVSSGETVQAMTARCLEWELGGLEYMAGIPGTLGGAVYGNAGAFNQAIGDALISATILTSDGEIIEVDRDYFEFQYRWSRLKREHGILIDASFSVRPRPRDQIDGEIGDYLKVRAEKHPPCGTWCAGSFFKNPVSSSGEKSPAAFYLDRIGAKGQRIGGAEVYSGHANFIINRGRATSLEIRRLAEELKRRVKEEFGIDLEEEVIYLPEEL